MLGENSYLLNMKTLNMFNIVTSGFLLNSSLTILYSVSQYQIIITLLESYTIGLYL